MNSPVRLNDLVFPQAGRLIHRTRLAFIHLEGVLAFAKRDRDGRVDGYLVSYLPDECVLVFLRRGEAVNAAAMLPSARQVITMSDALKRLRGEIERGEMAYCAAPMEQLAWMYQSCAVRPEPRLVDPARPAELFPALQAEKVTGVLELIVDGRVCYIRLDEGRFITGYFADKPDDQPVGRYVESLFQRRADGHLPAVVAGVFPPVADLPAQAPAALISTYRELYWRLVDAVETEFPGDAKKRADVARTTLAPTHRVLDVVSVPRSSDLPDAVVGPEELVTALGTWTRHYLEPLEVMMPGTAPKVLKAATREHRYVLQAAGFYAQLPWTVMW